MTKYTIKSKKTHNDTKILFEFDGAPPKDILYNSKESAEIAAQIMGYSDYYVESIETNKEILLIG